MEAVAILPQLFMVSKTGEAESITSHYLFALGVYRALYILNWIYRYYGEGFYDLIAIIAGIVQTILYCDFFYLYITRGLLNKEKKFSVLFIARNTKIFNLRYECNGSKFTSPKLEIHFRVSFV